MSTALKWFKSSYSTEQGGNCLEVAYDWRKSTHSDGPEGACVEVAAHPAAIHVRDSKNPGGPSLTLAPAAWASFVSDLR
ncbi:DUF397 domain-containing protein [Streptomyces sp. NPDC006540]|jgi:hypothetical protein|uniref:DUF397 domain-containing protein n=1 Tax=Streptomyces sp. NPDC006540 TaxID=3155353 RepID=UPI0033B2283F